ncbi:MAG: glucoamylase family protein [Tetrasphaera sp.]
MTRVGPTSAFRRRSEPWADTEPIRAEIFSAERFEEHARSLADSHMVLGSTTRVVPLLTRLKQDAAALGRAYEAISEDVRDEREITPAAEWLLDNFHTVEENIRQIRRDLPPDYFRQLPKLGPGFLQGHPRMFAIMWGYVAHTDSLLDAELLSRYIRAYETRKALTLGELWAVAITLRLLLVENLRRVADRVVGAGKDRRAADRVADGLLGIGGQPVALTQLIPDRAFVPSRAFAARLLRRLSGQQHPEAITWLQSRLGVDSLEPLALAEARAQSAATVTVRNIFTSLTLLADMNWEDWLESVSLIEEELRTDEGYQGLDFPTRNLNRSAIEDLARGSGQAEIDVTRAALQWARHGVDEPGRDIGYWLLDSGRRAFARSIGYHESARSRGERWLRQAGLPGYLLALTVAMATVLGMTWWLVTRVAPSPGPLALTLLGALSAVAFSDWAVSTVNYWAARIVSARPLPGLALRDGVPHDLRTLVVIPTLLTSIDDIDQLVDQLQVHYLANPDGELYYGLATDWPDAPEKDAPGDHESLARARAGIAALNTRHGERFLLFHRDRRFNPAEGVWMGWERKRGKLDELNKLLRSQDSLMYVAEGRLPGPFRYVITLDSDTRLPREAARRLVGKMAHPLNRARLDHTGRKVARGYGIMQPRVTPSLPMAEDSSLLQRTYSTQRGADRYAFAVSDAYQDLFEQGSFTGKGIYDIDIVDRTVSSRIPENRVLSHDLLEGNYARSGLVTDVEVVEEHPTSYAVTASRAHRWARGDWQLLPWLVRPRSGISALGLWKMADNVRRSLAKPAQVAALIAALALLPVRGVAVWLGVVLLTYFAPHILPVLPRFLLNRKGITRRSQLTGALSELRDGLLVAAFDLTFLAHQAWLMLDAVVRTLIRLLFTRRHLLEWTTAAAAGKGGKRTLPDYIRLMAGGTLLAIAVLAVGAWRGPGHLALAIVPGLLWLLAPAVAWASSWPSQEVEAESTPQERAALRLVARRTWAFFTSFVTADDNHLPPDNFQEEPRPTIAHRTSPTNVGLYLLTVVSAREFGWIGLAEAADRCERTLATLARMQRYRGHFFNWIDTRSLAPLEPRYVSTVDSGNLAGHLLTLACAVRGWAQAIDAAPASLSRDGVADALAVLDSDAETAPELPASLREAADAVAATLHASTAAEDPLQSWVAVEEAAANLAAAAGLSRAADDGPEVRPTGALAVAAGAVEATVTSLGRDLRLDDEARTRLAGRLRAIADRADDLFQHMDFTFLRDPHRNLLSVGYHVPTGRLDEACYDLLASEARLTSYVAVIKRHVRTRHWFLLGRPVTAVQGGAALQSWSGSMFEYLMPPLVMRSPHQSLLAHSDQMAVRRQMDYAQRLGIPWGISEAAYNARDVHYTYQYSPFGVPGLGIVRGLADNLVVAPYATGLAAMVFPKAAVENYRRLADLGALGRFGYYESVDFTPARVPQGSEHAVVRCYMAHHQGMTIVAIHNAVCGGAMRAHFHADPLVRSGDLLLQERAQTDVPVSHPRGEEGRAQVVRDHAAPEERVFSGAAAYAPAVQHLSNGRLSLTLTPSGGGQLRWQGLAITRWHPDPSTEEAGDHIFLRDFATGESWSATPLPLVGSPSSCETRMADDTVSYVRQHNRFATHLDYHISPEADAMVRRLTIRNRQRKERRLTVLSYAELALAPILDDDAHPVFSRMFVTTEFLPDRSAIIAHRRRRSPHDQQVWAAHVLQVEDGAGLGRPTAETDRAAFLGRGNTIREAAQVHGQGPLRATTGHVLDAIFSLRQRVRVPGDGETRVLFWTFVAESRERLLALIDAHQGAQAHQRLAMLAWTQSQVELRDLGITPREAMSFQTLAGHITYPTGALRPPAASLQEDTASQSGLWPLGVSGDLPIALVRIDRIEDLPVIQQLIRAFEYWRIRRFAVDLVLLNREPTSYRDELHHALERLAGSIRARTGARDSTGRIYVLRVDQTEARTLRGLAAAAAVVLDASAGDLGAQLRAVAAPVITPQRPASPAPAPLDATERPGLEYDNGHGGFASGGREYCTVIEEGRPTPAPWSNIVANENFGFVATAEGAGSTWWRNSRDNQLTSWRNDPVSALPSEVVYVKDEISGRIATPTAAPIDTGRHLCWHGFGYTAYIHQNDDVRLDLLQFVAGDDPVKVSRLRVTNVTDRTRTYIVTTYHESVLGLNRQQTWRRQITSVDPQTGALIVRNPWSLQYADQVAFVDLCGAQESLTGDRREFLGVQGSLREPAAVRSDAPLSGRVGAGLDPCAALRTRLTLDPGASADVRILLGAAYDIEQARELIRRHRDAPPIAALDAVKSAWADTLDRVVVRVPDRAFELMMGGWLLYQTLASRMLARTGYYQASGAYGFRDQLQDGMAVVLVDPAMARSHLIRAAGRQFPEGDVQHWWLPADGSGIRTRMSDDVVWLAHAVARYVTVTADVGVLDVEIPWLEGRALEPHEGEAFFTPGTSEHTATLYDHCTRGLERAFTMGSHGLPLMGTGDWNDGMNRVGADGRGESVWLGWFLLQTLSVFLPIAEGRRDHAFVARSRMAAEELRQALEREAWDGAWYRRGYFDDGTPLGSRTRPECQIDSIAQSWAVLSGQAQPDRETRALRSVEERLIVRDPGIARLFTPPFDTSEPDPGYLRSYPPGIRENGGQYTHGATWLIFAYARLGEQERAGDLFALINPVNHARTLEEAATYRVEPYVVAADVYSVEPHVGRGGWTWYTGSSGWLYRAGLEAILGLQRRGDTLDIHPCVPPQWPWARVEYRHGGTTYTIHYDMEPREAVPGSTRRLTATWVDGVRLPDPHHLALDDDGGAHEVRLTLKVVDPAG